MPAQLPLPSRRCFYLAFPALRSSKFVFRDLFMLPLLPQVAPVLSFSLIAFSFSSSSILIPRSEHKRSALLRPIVRQRAWIVHPSTGAPRWNQLVKAVTTSADSASLCFEWRYARSKATRHLPLSCIRLRRISERIDSTSCGWPLREYACMIAV